MDCTLSFYECSLSGEDTQTLPPVIKFLHSQMAGTLKHASYLWQFAPAFFIGYCSNDRFLSLESKIREIR